jgi:uncharacterized membrane protein YgcG
METRAQGRNDGVLLLVALKDRRMRIEVGAGLEGTITDIQAAAIIDREMTPRFRGGDFAGGIRAAVHSLSALIAGPSASAADADMQVHELPSDTAPAIASRDGHVTPEGWALLGVALWSLAVGAWHGRGMAGNARERTAVQQSGRKRKGQAQREAARQGKERSPRALGRRRGRHRAPAPRRKPNWRVALGLFAVGPVAAAAALLNPLMAGFMAMPAGFAYGVGYASGRSRAVSYVVGGIALFIAALVAVAFIVGEEHFWWGFLWALGRGRGRRLRHGHLLRHAGLLAQERTGFPAALGRGAGRHRLGGGDGAAGADARRIVDSGRAGDLHHAAVRVPAVRRQRRWRRQRRQRLEQQLLEQLVVLFVFLVILVVRQRRRLQQRRRRLGKLVVRGLQGGLRTP